MFGSIDEESLKLHERLKSFPNAGAYNKIFGASENRIELVKGIKDKHPLILKTRVTGSWRKFFNVIISEEGDLLILKNWTGDFDAVDTIYQ